MDAVTEGGSIHQSTTRRRLMLPSRRTLLASGVAIAVAAAGGWWIASPPTSESTDDAYVAADATSVAPKVRGLIAAIYVRDNQPVRAGQVLVRIDPEEFDAGVDAATAQVADSAAGIAAARAALVSLDAEERLAAANIVAARTSIRSARAQSTRASADRGRYQALVASGAVARADADRFDAVAVTAEQDAARASALLDVAQETSGVTSARRAGLVAGLQTAQAKAAASQAALALAKQDQSHTEIRAAIDGVVGNRLARVGDYVQAGSRLLTLVPLHAVYVTANFKETQTARMHPGQAARIEVDALPGTEIDGVVDSFAPGSGASFALLPFEPGTGNFTKIVQRVPVRIRFDPGQANVGLLRPGLSVTAKVDLQSAK